MSRPSSRLLLSWQGFLLCLLLLAACDVGSTSVPHSSATATPDSTEVATTTPLVASDAGRVAAIPSMQVARADHSAVLLANGTVLIAGGCTNVSGCEGGSLSATTEIYDPQTSTFRRGPSMRDSRAGDQSATLLPNGMVLIAGGWGTQALASAELYNPTTETFTPTSPMHLPRTAQTATLLLTGQVLLTGGYDGRIRLASAELYDPQTGTFSLTGSMSTPRSAHMAALLPDGRVLITGGDSDEHTVLNSAEIYNPATGTFTPTGTMSVVRRKHAAVALQDGRVLVVGGANQRDSGGAYASAEIYDPRSGTFTQTGSMSVRRYKIGAAVALLKNGDVLVAGGNDLVEVYDPQTGTFKTAEGHLGATRFFTSVALLPDGTVLITGGYDNHITLTANAWVYHPGS
ncbi:MAG TPA: kelch repeat-containing protein [Ktedonobacterales bacterium]